MKILFDILCVLLRVECIRLRDRKTNKPYYEVDEITWLRLSIMYHVTSHTKIKRKYIEQIC